MNRPHGTHPIYWRTLHFEPPNDWCPQRFDTMVTVEKGRLPKNLLAEATETSMPYLLIEGFFDGDPRFTDDKDLPLVVETDTVIVADGSRSGLALRGVKGALGSTLLRCRATEEHNQDFIHCLLESLFGWLNTATIGGAVPHLDKQLLGRLSICIPNKAEQLLVSEAITAIDVAIRAAKSELEKTRRLNKALLQQVFTKGLPGRHQYFRQTKIGSIPTEWDLPTLGSFADIEAGVALNQDREPRSNAYQYLTVVNVQRGSVSIDEPRFLELWKSEVPKKLLRAGDIVVVEGHANSGEIGRAAMIQPEQDGLTYQNHLFRVRLTGEGVCRDFLLHALNAEYARRHWNAVCNTSSGLNTINRRQLRRLLIPQPKPDEQAKIVEMIALSEKAISTVRSKVTAVERLKQSLLQNLLTGRVRLRDGASA